MAKSNYDLKIRFSKKFGEILKEYKFRQDLFTGAQFASSTICEYANGRRGMHVDSFVALLRLAKFNNKFIRDQVTDVLKTYYSDVVQDFKLIKEK